MLPAFVRGQVVNAPVLDPQGRNLKIRPCVVTPNLTDLIRQAREWYDARSETANKPREEPAKL